MKFVLLNAIVKYFPYFQIQFSCLIPFRFGLGFSRNIIISFEIVLMKVILYECYCEIMTGLVEIFMKALLINRHWIYVIPQISSHLTVVYKRDPEDGVQRVQAYTGHCQVHGVQ